MSFAILAAEDLGRVEVDVVGETHGDCSVVILQCSQGWL